jgi:hypothetical protein
MDCAAHATTCATITATSTICRVYGRTVTRHVPRRNTSVTIPFGLCPGRWDHPRNERSTPRFRHWKWLTPDRRGLFRDIHYRSPVCRVMGVGKGKQEDTSLPRKPRAITCKRRCFSGSERLRAECHPSSDIRPSNPRNHKCRGLNSTRRWCRRYTQNILVDIDHRKRSSR